MHALRARCDVTNVTDARFDIDLFPGVKNSIKINTFLFGLIPILGGLSLLKTMKKLAFVSIFGTIAIIGAIVVVVYFSVSYIDEHGHEDAIIETIWDESICMQLQP